MTVSISSSQIIVKIIRKSDGKQLSMNIPENANHKVQFIKSHVKNTFHSRGKFHLYYQNRHIKSRHELRYYGITSQIRNIEIFLV